MHRNLSPNNKGVILSEIQISDINLLNKTTIYSLFDTRF